MLDWADKIIEVIKLPVKFVWIAFIFCGIFLFLPADWVVFLGLESMNEDFRSWIGPIFVLAFCKLIVDLFLVLKKKVTSKRSAARRNIALIDSLLRLDPHEQSILREFHVQQRTTIQLPYDHPTVSGMLKNGLLKLSGSTYETSMAGHLMSMQVNPDIQDLITLEVMGLPGNDALTEQQLQWVRENRPEFMYEIEHHNNLFHKHWSRGM